MAAQKTLLSLPAEMLMAIANEADPHDVLALRSCCRRLSAAAEDHFIDAFFTKRSHFFSRASLQALIAITADPRLVAKITEVEFVAVKLNFGQFPAASLSDGEIGGGLDVCRRYSNACDEAVGNQSVVEDEEKDGEEKEVGYEMILQIFENLMAAKVVPVVSAYGKEDVGGTFGLQHLDRLGILLKVCRWAYDDVLGSAILEAIVLTGFPVTSLALPFGPGLNLMSEAVLSKAIGSAPFWNLSDITISFDAEWLRDSSSMKSLFASATRLQHLSIKYGPNGAGWQSRDGFDRHPLVIIGHALSASTSLASLKINDVVGHSEHFIQFFHQFKHTLKEVALLNVGVDGDDYDGCWSILCNILAKDFRLEKVELKNLTREYGLATFACGTVLSDVGMESVDDYHCVLQGEAQVQAGLRLLAEAPTYMYEDVSDDDESLLDEISEGDTEDPDDDLRSESEPESESESEFEEDDEGSDFEEDAEPEDEN